MLKSQISSDTVTQMLKMAAGYCEAGKAAEAEAVCRQILSISPKYPGAFHVLGILAAQAERYDDAVGFFRKALREKEDIAVFHYHLALALQKQGKFPAAEKEYARTLALQPDYVDVYSNLGTMYIGQKRWEDARVRLERLLEIRPNDAEACSDLGVVLKKLDRRDAATVSFMKAIILKPDYANGHFNLANSLLEDRMYDDAVTQYEKAVALKPDFFAAYLNLGEAYKRQGRPDMCARYYAKALELDPESDGALGSLVHARQHICDWNGIGAQEQTVLALVRKGAKNIPPFGLMAMPSTAADQLVNARNFLQAQEEAVPSRVYSHHPPRARGKLRVGYLSADFFPHATTFLIAELFERHDRSRFEITGYSYGRDDMGYMRDRLLNGMDRFVDMRLMSDDHAAQKIHDDGIDILIDLKGYTTGGRPGIPARRPAPVQVNYLGFPATMGADFIDYIIGDPFITPMDQQAFYSEKIVQMPDCYQPNDTTRRIVDPPPSRAECGLPEDAFVFCCFNNTYKITPRFFDIWMRLLKAVPGSVLWLFEANQGVKGNLLREASARGVDPARLVFAPGLQLEWHLARHKHADLF
ncbi:MAG: tetratricopeptide repeat protein, partial [Alphaproteobacteria bacterium]|nr:tetratricopeptide repeat protein [Alphaproteobacteria bacterium]